MSSSTKPITSMTSIDSITTLDHFYICAHKIKSVRCQCSHCGTFVANDAITCEHCGADLR